MYNGGLTSFPDIYEFEIDDVAFVSDLLEVSHTLSYSYETKI